MFSSPHVSINDSNDYDFEKVENAAKWKNVFITSLRKVSFCRNISRLWFVRLSDFYNTTFVHPPQFF